jgi:hypothetical protein
MSRSAMGAASLSLVDAMGREIADGGDEVEGE